MLGEIYRLGVLNLNTINIGGCIILGYGDGLWFKFIYLLFRGTVCEQGGGAERERETERDRERQRIPRRLSTVSAKPDTGLELTR